jgi:Monooxygenase af470-like
MLAGPWSPTTEGDSGRGVGHREPRRGSLVRDTARTVNRGRFTARVDGEFVVFLIGMRINRPWKVRQWLPVARAMPLSMSRRSSLTPTPWADRPARG